MPLHRLYGIISTIGGPWRRYNTPMTPQEIFTYPCDMVEIVFCSHVMTLYLSLCTRLMLCQRRHRENDLTFLNFRYDNNIF
jgi:hypothetical protein